MNVLKLFRRSDCRLCRRYDSTVCRADPYRPAERSTRISLDNSNRKTLSAISPLFPQTDRNYFASVSVDVRLRRTAEFLGIAVRERVAFR